MYQKKVLLISPYFAPQSHAAVFRIHKLAKYLHNFGWQASVLTVNRNYLYNEDPEFLSELPDSLIVHRENYVEPSIRGLRMLLGGRDRSFKKTKNVLSTGNIACSGGLDKGCKSTLQRIYKYVLDHFLQCPDRHWTWYRAALSKARHIIATEGVSVVFTTSMPFTTMQLGASLRKLGVFWVADFRDPCTYSEKFYSRVPRVFAAQRKIERETLSCADAVTVTSSSYVSIFSDLYGPDVVRKTNFIPTGIDEDYVAVNESVYDPGFQYFVYVGEYLEEYGGNFLNIFAAFLKKASVPKAGVKLLFVGHRILNESRVKPYLAKFGLSDNVQFLDHCHQQELYRIIKGALASVLIPGKYSHWWNLFAKMIDAIGLRTPVVAIVPDPSEARSQLTRAGLGVFLDGDIEEQVSTFLQFFLTKSTGVVNREVCSEYTAKQQVMNFARVFDALIEKNKGKFGMPF